MSILIVIPTLNEEAHISEVITGLVPFANSQSCRVVVADGGSVDGTIPIVRNLMSTYPWLHLIDNPDRFQSAAVNHSVDQYGDGCKWLIRLDAHAQYPQDFLRTLLDDAQATSADSVVVSMIAQGEGRIQSLIAIAQNSKFGNGGSAHRDRSEGRWVIHGHHALFRMQAFKEVGGYDPTFSHNEDAELDLRLSRRGFRIWLTAKTSLIYFPRQTFVGLIKQYMNFGGGRAATFAKHRLRPAPRQAVVIALLPALLCTVLAPVTWVALIPLLAWLAACGAAGVFISRSNGQVRAILAGPIAGVMQLAWSVGFWRACLLTQLRKA